MLLKHDRPAGGSLFVATGSMASCDARRLLRPHSLLFSPWHRLDVPAPPARRPLPAAGGRRTGGAGTPRTRPSTSSTPPSSAPSSSSSRAPPLHHRRRRHLNLISIKAAAMAPPRQHSSRPNLRLSALLVPVVPSSSMAAGARRAAVGRRRWGRCVTSAWPGPTPTTSCFHPRTASHRLIEPAREE